MLPRRKRIRQRKPDAASQEAKSTAPQPVSIFPDKTLETAVRAEVFEKRYNDEPITEADVAKISRVINVPSVRRGDLPKIQSLEGLQHCKALMLIDLKDNEIADLKPIAQSQTLAVGHIGKEQDCRP